MPPRSYITSAATGARVCGKVANPSISVNGNTKFNVNVVLEKRSGPESDFPEQKRHKSFSEPVSERRGSPAGRGAALCRAGSVPALPLRQDMAGAPSTPRVSTFVAWPDLMLRDYSSF